MFACDNLGWRSINERSVRSRNGGPALSQARTLYTVGEQAMQLAASKEAVLPKKPQKANLNYHDTQWKSFFLKSVVLTLVMLSKSRILHSVYLVLGLLN